MATETIINSGLGGFLNPPNDPEYNFSLMIGLRVHMSLRSALEDERVSDETKEKIRKLFNTHKGKFTEEWEHSCYNYFRNCYSPDGIDRNANNCIISKEYKNPEHHLAYMLIKSFFPNYKPNLELIAHNGDKGRWGSKG